MKVGAMGNYHVNDKPEANFPARVTWVNEEERTVDLMVMVHAEDYPEFTKEECAAGHAHRLGVETGKEPGTFQPDAESAAAADTRVDELMKRVEDLEISVFNMDIRVTKLSQPSAS